MFLNACFDAHNFVRFFSESKICIQKTIPINFPQIFQFFLNLIYSSHINSFQNINDHRKMCAKGTIIKRSSNILTKMRKLKVKFASGCE